MRRAEQRARFHQLLNAPTDEAAPDFVVPANLQESRQRASGSVQVSLPRPITPGPAWGELSAEEVLKSVPWLSKGARKLFHLLHLLAVAAAQGRRYPVIPSSQCLPHAPAPAGCRPPVHPRHLRRLAQELEHAGLIDGGAHASKVRTKLGTHRHLWDGSIWAVKLRPSTCNVYLSPDDWRHEWRDFQADLKTGRTAEKIMSYLNTCEGLERQEHVLKIWAVNPNAKIDFVVFRADISNRRENEPPGHGLRPAPDRRTERLEARRSHRKRGLDHRARPGRQSQPKILVWAAVGGHPERLLRGVLSPVAAIAGGCAGVQRAEEPRRAVRGPPEIVLMNDSISTVLGGSFER